MTQFANYPSLKDRVIFITGGASGIGAALVAAFCAQGSKVAFVDQDATAAAKLIDEISQRQQATPLFLPCDLRNISALKQAIAQASATLGDVAVLINNAGNDQRHATLQVDEAQWRSIIADNLDHYFFAAQAVLPIMMKNRAGSIINVSSNCFLIAPQDEYIGYMTAKAAIIGLGHALAREYGPYDIRVNNILPGWVMTQKQLEKWLTPQAENELLSSQMLKEKLYPDDIARMALFLAADDSRMYTKMDLLLDAGRA